jgi:flap endonuclease-1
MGVKKLTKVINKNAPNVIQNKKIDEFKGKTVAIDASLMIHQIVIAMRGTGKDLVNRNGELTSHLYGVFYKNINFLELGIKPLYVFDGKPPSLKNMILEKRKEIKTKAIAKLIDEKLDEIDKIKQFKKTFSLTKKHIEECKILLDLMGIPHITAPEEADAMCAYLAKKGFVDGVCSEDMDVLTFGAPVLYRNLINYSKKKKPEIAEINLKKVLTGMELTYDQFVGLCILLGCDYCPTIKGIGDVTALKMIKHHGSLENVLEFLNDKLSNDKKKSKKDNDITFETICFIEAKKYFKAQIKLIEKENLVNEDDIVWCKCQEDELIDYMVEKHSFDFIKIKNAVDRVKKYYKKNNIVDDNEGNHHKIIKKKNMYCLFIDD